MSINQRIEKSLTKVTDSARKNAKNMRSSLRKADNGMKRADYFVILTSQSLTNQNIFESFIPVQFGIKIELKRLFNCQSGLRVMESQ